MTSPDTEQLIRLLSRQLESRLRAGAVDATEQILAAHPDLEMADEEAVLDLIYVEITTREEMGQPADAAELKRRFPAWSQRIERLLAVHHAFQPDLGEAARETDVDVLTTDTAVWNRHVDLARERVGQYDILEELGRGGMGVVYKARQAELDRIVALKLIRESLGTGEDGKRLIHEAKTVARLDHPQIVKVHEAGYDDRQPYVCLEYVAGGSLADKLSRSTLEAKNACRMLKLLAQGAHYAHEQGVIHRDLKPANILLTLAGQPKIADFGLAKSVWERPAKDLSEHLTQTGAILGSLCYMAPEQVTGRNDQIGVATDVYGLGAILYEMLVGRPPFVRESPLDTAGDIQFRDPLSPRTLVPNVPRDVETICLKCLEKDPQRRYQNAAELADELDRFLKGEPIHARPVGKLIRGWQWAKRKPAIAALITSIAALLVIMAIGGSTMAIQQTKLTAAAEAKAEEAAKLSEFMLDTLRSPDPSRDGREVTVAERLDDAVDNIETLSDLSPTKATLLHALGKAYYGLALYPNAHESLIRSLELRRQLLGDDAVDTLLVERDLADTCRVRGDHDEALRLLQHAVPGLVAALGPDDEQSILGRLYLAKTFLTLDRMSEAERLLRAAYDSASTAGNANETFVLVLHGLIDALLKQGKSSEARELVAEQLDTIVSHENIERTAILKKTMADVYRQTGESQVALELYLEALQLRRETRGDGHTSTIVLMNNLAVLYSELGQYDKSLEMKEQVVKSSRELHGDNHLYTIVSINNLALSYGRLSRIPEALTLHQEAYERSQKALGVDHRTTLLAMSHYARTLAEVGEIEESLALQEQCLAICRSKEDLDPVTKLGALFRTATAYYSAERWSEALALYEETLTETTEILGESHLKTLACRYHMALCHARLGEPNRAIKILEEVADAAIAQHGQDHPFTLTTQRQLVRVYRVGGQVDRAVELGHQVVSAAARATPDRWQMYAAQFELSRAMLDQPEYEESAELLATALTGLQQLFAGEPVLAQRETIRQLEEIIGLYETADRTVTADALRDQLAALQSLVGRNSPD